MMRHVMFVRAGRRPLSGGPANLKFPMSSGSGAYFAQVAANFAALSKLEAIVDGAARRIAAALQAGHKIMFCGNGGSAADSQHLAAELIGRYRKERAPLPALALTVDTSALTAIANDYSYADIFVRQLRGLGRSGDVLVALSTSGNSDNVLRAALAAKELGILTVGLTGRGGGKLRQAVDIPICVPAEAANHIQEMHIAIGHYICGYVEDVAT
jgi:D-sedoheptulose 7-phosphate isomerase